MRASDLVIPLLASAVSAPAILVLLRRVKSRQTISQYVEEHAHKQGTPTMGGLIVLVGVLAAAFTLIPTPERYAVLALALGFGLIGFIDDFVVPRMVKGSRGLGWKEKLAMQVVFAAGAAYASGLQSASAIALTVFAVLFMSNAYNFADGMDGLAGGLGVMLAGTLGLLAALRSEPGVAVAMAALAVSFLPFLWFNWPAARVFMGDVGALPFGALMGWAMTKIAVTPEGNLDLPHFWPILILAAVMLIELVPVPLQIASVKLRKGKRLFPFKTPVHHAFQSAGWPEPRVVALFYGAQWAACALAVALAPGGVPHLPWLGLGLVLILAMLCTPGKSKEVSHA